MTVAEALGLRGIRAERVTCPGLLSLRKFLLLGSRGRLVRLRGCLIAHARYRRTVIVSDEPGDKMTSELFQSSTETALRCYCGHIKNAEQLQRHLITFVAANIPNYWMRSMRPEVTEKAAIYAKARITSSIETIYNFAATPDDRADLARSQAFLRLLAAYARAPRC